MMSKMKETIKQLIFCRILFSLFVIGATNVYSDDFNTAKFGNKTRSQLTVYYLPIQYLTGRPLGKNELLVGYEKKVVIELRGSQPLDALTERLKNIDYSSFKKTSRAGQEVNMRLLCQLQTKEQKFEFGVGHNDDLIYVNGLIGEEDADWYFNHVKYALQECMIDLLPKDFSH
jgi:hypothetical protein